MSLTRPCSHRLMINSFISIWCITPVRDESKILVHSACYLSLFLAIASHLQEKSFWYDVVRILINLVWQTVHCFHLIDNFCCDRATFSMMSVQIHPIVSITRTLQPVMVWEAFYFFFQVNLYLWEWQDACVLEDPWPPAVIELGPSFILSHHGEFFYVPFYLCVSSLFSISTICFLHAVPVLECHVLEFLVQKSRTLSQINWSSRHLFTLLWICDCWYVFDMLYCFCSVFFWAFLALVAWLLIIACSPIICIS